jgi:hypothetical protein
MKHLGGPQTPYDANWIVVMTDKLERLLGRLCDRLVVNGRWLHWRFSGTECEQIEMIFGDDQIGGRLPHQVFLGHLCDGHCTCLV